MSMAVTDASIWQTLHERLDPRQLRPKIRSDVVVQQFDSKRLGTYYMLKSPEAGTYLRLSPREYFLVSLMDGERTIKDLVVAYFLQYRSMAFNRVIQVVELLHSRMFLTTTPIATYTLVRGELRTRSWRTRLGRVHAFVMRSEVAVPNVDGFVTALHRTGGRFLFVRPLLALYAVVIVLGLLKFLLAGHLGRPDIARAFGSGVSTVAIVLGFFAVLIFVHEMAHALACKHFGREVRRGGFTLFFGFPAFFVDTTDIWLESRPRRVAVSAAGTLSDLLIAGTLFLLAPLVS